MQETRLRPAEVADTLGRLTAEVEAGRAAVRAARPGTPERVLAECRLVERVRARRGYVIAVQLRSLREAQQPELPGLGGGTAGAG